MIYRFCSVTAGDPIRIVALLVICIASGCVPSWSPTQVASAAVLDDEPLLYARSDSNAPIRPITVPESMNPEKIRLGKAMFHDVRMSNDNSLSCSSCHLISEGGDDNRPQSIGIDGQVGELNAPTVLNASNQFVQFWDGRAATLTEQVNGPVHNSLEMGSDWDDIVAKLGQDSDVVSQFGALYADGLSEASIIDAIVAYEEALVTPDAPFDQFLRGDEQAISESAREGHILFQELGCIACHQGVNVGGNLYQRLGVMDDYFEQFSTIAEADYGRFNVTGREEDRFRFKTPSLRNVATTGPYFHDGSVSSLEGAVRLMAHYQLGRRISNLEVKKLVDFLESLTGQIDEALL